MFLLKSNGRGIGFPHLQRNGGKAKAFGPAQQLIEQSIGDALAAMCRKNRHISDAALIQYIFHAKVAKRFPFPLRLKEQRAAVAERFCQAFFAPWCRKAG